MRFSKLMALFTLSALVLFTLPALADTYQQFTLPTDGNYLTSTTNFGGGDGSGSDITSLGPFQFSVAMNQRNVPNSWATWGSPPFTESSTPNVLYSNGATSMTLSLTDTENVVGFEIEPDLFQEETFDFIVHTTTGAADPFSVTANGSAGAMLFAVKDLTPGAQITSIDITDTAGDDFAIAELRSGEKGTSTTPEPSSILLFGSGILGLAGLLRRKMNL